MTNWIPRTGSSVFNYEEHKIVVGTMEQLDKGFKQAAIDAVNEYTEDENLRKEIIEAMYKDEWGFT